MTIKSVTAIVRENAIENVVESLRTVQIRGVTVSRASGYGEYINNFSSSHLDSCARIEVFVDEDIAESVAKIIMHAAHTGLSGDGIVAILPVEKLYRVKELKPVVS